MRFEELAYAVDGLLVAVRFHARLTVVCLPGEERVEWTARLFGVLEGTRAGDGASVVYLDRRGRRVGLGRDGQGGATLLDLATGAEVPYSAGHLSLDGRFDWFASNNLTYRAASDLILVGSGAFTGKEKYDPQAIESQLEETRKRLARTEGKIRSAAARTARRDELRDRIAAFDEQIAQAEADSAGALAQSAGVPDELESLAKACRAVAERRDHLVARLNGGAPADVEEQATEMQRELIEDVEPAFVDALAALATACRTFDVTIDAVRIEKAGIDAAGIEVLCGDVLAEVAARAGVEPPGDDVRRAVAERSKLAQALQRVERNLPDVAGLAERHSALEGEAAALEAMLQAGRSLVSVQEAELILLRRAAEAGRNDRRREPLPLVVDDALAPFGTSDKRRLLDAVARCAETTQIVYLTDDPVTISWAGAQAADGEVGLWGRDDIATA